MFAKIFGKSNLFTIPTTQGALVWAISANEKTIVIWNKDGATTKIVSLDKTNEGWIQKDQEFQLAYVQAPHKIHLNENGNILIHYSNDRQVITTWQRQHRNDNWIQKNQTKYVPNQNPTANNITVAFHKNQIFATHQENLTVVQRTGGMKMVRKQKVLYNDYLTCLCYDYVNDRFLQSTDGVMYFWYENKEYMWDRELPCWPECDTMPFYSQSQDSELKAFVVGAVWVIAYPERTYYSFKDDRIKDVRTQSALNYFIQKENNVINFWSRKNKQQNEFNFESVPIEAADILLSQQGTVFATQQKGEKQIIIQIYEKI